ncbi:hypothetical protein Fmac_030101 [Flemingia macrophylla]|uniref:Uncharacterized protein n=1 Tax=Flemingia macrophylla TaxID=520843 RepID=A0ABD1LC86_9FABA
MSPRIDDYENDTLSATDDEDDDIGLKEDMAALAQACTLATNIPKTQDPLLAPAGPIVLAACDSDSDSDSGHDDLECLKSVQSLYQPLVTLPPLERLPAASDSDDDGVDDLETVRAIMRRFNSYGKGHHEGGIETKPERDQASSLGCEGGIANGSIHYESDGGGLCPASQDPIEATTKELAENGEIQLSDFVVSFEPDACGSSRFPQKRSNFHPVVQHFIDAIKQNREMQRFLRSKLIALEAKIEENKQIRNKIKILKDFQVSCTRRTGSALSLKKDPRVQLISAKKSTAPKNSKVYKVINCILVVEVGNVGLSKVLELGNGDCEKKHIKVPAMCYGPEENSRVANYRMVLERFPLSLDRKKWSKAEIENLSKGIKQQFQEMVFQVSVDRISLEGSFGDANDMDNIIASVKDLEITPERIREFLPKVNWDQLASMHVAGRTAAECESSVLCFDIGELAPDMNQDIFFLIGLGEVGEFFTSWEVQIENKLTNGNLFKNGPAYDFMLDIYDDHHHRHLLFLDFNKSSRSTHHAGGAVHEMFLNMVVLNMWLNCHDPLINQGAWTNEEDKSLLLCVQDMGIRNWFDIAASLGTRRTPFQCLSRFQRSLNPSMLNSEWTEEEDAQLCSAVACFGEKDWQSVASVLERRTGAQCSNRWKKSLCPDKKGSFTREEDIRLTVAVMLFGRKWNLIAKYVPGRIQSQCRDRYLNSLDPSLKWGGWTEEEDLRLETAIAKHGYCWSKIAEEVPPRTDSQCRKRWKVICPEQVPLLQEARKKQRSIIGSNFVDRESDRPTITLNDFLPCVLAPKSDDVGASNCRKRGKSSNFPKKTSSKKRAKETRRRTKEVENTEVYSDDDEIQKEVPDSVRKKTRFKRHAKSTRSCRKEVVDTSCSDRVNSTCISSSENQDSDDGTLASFIHDKSKILSRVGNKDLLVKPNVASDRQVGKPEDANTLTSDDDSGMTLACFLGNRQRKGNQTNKSKKGNQAAKGFGARSSKLKKSYALLREGHCATKPAIKSDDSGKPSISSHVEEETVLHGAVAEHMDINVKEIDDALFSSFSQSRPKRQTKRPNRICVTLQPFQFHLRMDYDDDDGQDVLDKEPSQLQLKVDSDDIIGY